MIQLNDISIYLTVNGRALVSGLSFTLSPGDRTVIIGEEGNGKSTLLALIADPALIADHAEYTGTISLGGHRIGYLPQELARNERALSVPDYMALDAENAWKAECTAAELGLDPVILSDPRPLSTLSGGERVKLRMTKVLLHEPDMLLLDEPTNDIDIETLEWLEDLIGHFAGGVLFVSHDETLIENTATAVIHLEHVHHKKVARHTVANIPYREYVERRERAFSRQEQEANKEREEQKKKEERWLEIYEKVNRDQRNISRQDPSGGRLLKKKMHSVMSQGRRLEKERAAMTELPVWERQIFLDLPEVSLPARKEILRFHTDGLTSPGGGRLTAGFDLRVDAQDHIAIIGQNGVGKTTLMRLIEAELETRPDIRPFYMPQNYFESFAPGDTPITFLAPSGRKEDITLARTYLGSVRFTADEAESPVERLSGGQKAKLMFVKMALEGYNVLLLDEPTRNFSPLSCPVIRGILSGFGGCIISISHDRKYIREVCTRVLRLTRDGLFPADDI